MISSFISCAVKVQALFLNFDWITSLFAGSNEQGAYITEPIIEGLVNEVSKFTTVAWYFLYSILGSQFSPSMETFYKMFSGGSEAVGKTVVIPLQSTLTIIGFILALTIFIISLISFARASYDTRQGGILNIITGFMVSVGIIYLAPYITDYLIEFFMKIWDILIAEIIISNPTVTDPKEISTMITSYLGSSGGAAGDIVIPQVFVLIFTIILMVTIIINLMRLVVEIVERYVVFAFLILCFPSASGFLVSASTRKIFASYMQMVFCQVFLLFMNIFFVRGFFLLLGAGCFRDIVSTIFIVAYLRVAQRVDTYLNKMGLSVAQTGGNLMDSCLGALGTMMVLGRGVSSGRRSAGDALSRVAAANGNYGLAGVSAAIGGDRRLKTDEGKVSLFANQGGVTNAGLNGNTRLTDDAGYMRGLQQIYKNGKNNTLNQHSVNDKQALLNSLSNGKLNEMLPRNMNVDGITFDKQGGALLSGSFADGTTADLKLKQGINEKGNMGVLDIDGNSLSMVGVGDRKLPNEGLSYDNIDGSDTHLSKGEVLSGINLGQEGEDYKNNAARFQNAIDGGIDVQDLHGNTILHKESDGTMCYNHGIGVTEEHLNNGTLKNIPLQNISIQGTTENAIFIKGTNHLGEKVEGALVNRATNQSLKGTKVNGTKQTGSYYYNEKKQKKGSNKE